MFLSTLSILSSWATNSIMSSLSNPIVPSLSCLIKKTEHLCSQVPFGSQPAMELIADLQCVFHIALLPLPRFFQYGLTAKCIGVFYTLLFHNSTVTDFCQSSEKSVSVHSDVAIPSSNFTPISSHSLIASLAMAFAPDDLFRGLFLIYVSIS